MAKVTVTQTVNAPADQTWAAWDDFANINTFNPNINASFLINDSKPTGKGAQRQCDMADGKNWVKEEIISYNAGRQMVVDIYETSMPMKSARATVTVDPIQSDRCRVTMSMDFEPGMGILGKLMLPMMKPKFTGMLSSLLKENARHVERRAKVQAVA